MLASSEIALTESVMTDTPLLKMTSAKTIDAISIATNP
jgi:hypothetical protein